MELSPTRVSASQIALILERAAEIDAGGDTLTVEELRRIADEAGITPAATETAIQEIMAGSEVPRFAEAPVVEERTGLPVRKQGGPSPGWIVAGGAVGMAMGFIFALPNVFAVPAFGATILYLVVRAVQSMKKRSQLGFQLQNFAVWFGMAMGGAATGAFVDITNFFAMLICWIVTSVVGGMIVQFGPSEEEPEADTPRLVPGGEQRRGARR